MLFSTIMCCPPQFPELFPVSKIYTQPPTCIQPIYRPEKGFHLTCIAIFILYYIRKVCKHSYSYFPYTWLLVLLSSCWRHQCSFLSCLYCRSEVAQSCTTVCDPIDCSLPGSSVHGIFQARILEWVAVSFSRGSSRPGEQTQVPRIAARRFTLWAT